MKKMSFAALLSFMLVTVILSTVYAGEPTKLTKQDVEFLTKQCQVAQVDVDIIPFLPKEAQDNISNGIASRDCKKFTSFKTTRNYYRNYYSKLKLGSKIQLPPFGWDSVYLTDEEFQRYSEILEKARW